MYCGNISSSPWNYIVIWYDGKIDSISAYVSLITTLDECRRMKISGKIFLSNKLGPLDDYVQCVMYIHYHLQVSKHFGWVVFEFDQDEYTN